LPAHNAKEDDVCGGTTIDGTRAPHMRDYGHHRLCVAAGLVRDTSVPGAKADLTTAVTVLGSLTLKPPSR